MIAQLLDQLKREGVSPQLDLGNFSVGIATMLIAVVSLLVAFRSTRSLNNQKLAEFRERWIDDLRVHISQFIGITYEILHHSLSTAAAEGENRQREIDTRHSDLRRVESYLITMLNSRETDHRLLIQLLQQIRGRAAAFSLGPEKELATDIDTLVDLTNSFAKIIFKTEWDRVRDATYGRGAINQRIRSFMRSLSRRNAERPIRKRALAFFTKNNIAQEGVS